MSVEEKLKDLQEALDRNFFKKEHSLRNRFQDLIDNIPMELQKVGRKYEVYSVGTKKKWIEWICSSNELLHDFDETFAEDKRLFEDFTRKFATYRASLELPVGEWLIKHAKTSLEVWNLVKGDGTYWQTKDKWVSVPEIQARLSGKVLIPKNQIENFKTNCIIRDKKEYESEIHIDRKQLSELKKTWNNRPLFWELKPNDWAEGSMADVWLYEMNRLFDEHFSQKGSLEAKVSTSEHKKETI